MRFIIHQLPYERTIVAGQLRYSEDGAPTGALEHYRMTAAVDDYRFLRVDLDAREAPSGRSTLYHMTLNPDGRPEQLKFRFWGEGLEIAGAIVWEGGQLTATREVNGIDYEDEAPDAPFWFPSATGLTLLRPVPLREKPVPAITLNQATDDPARAMALETVEVCLTDFAAEELHIGPQGYRAHGLHVAWGQTERRVWIHDDGWPLRVWRDDGLVAVSTQLVVYH